MPYTRSATLSILALTLTGAASCFAQTAPADSVAPASGARADQRIERIQIEDAGSRIDELRVGGETQSIVVAPKGGMPAYAVLPGSANRNLTRGERGSGTANGGTRVWKLLDF